MSAGIDSVNIISRLSEYSMSLIKTINLKKRVGNLILLQKE